MEDLETDVLVAGGGVGGLMAAYRAQSAGARVILLGGSGGASSRISSVNTALGYSEQDSPAGVFDDIVRAGGVVNDLRLVAALSHRIGPEILHLARLGVPFLRTGERLTRRQAAGSTWTRSVFSSGMIGVDIARTLTAELAATEPAAVHLHGGLLVELLVDQHRVVGALAVSSRDRRWARIRAGAVVLATGGCGQLFESTTNPRGSKGMGYAAALEAGATLSDMEFVSFEPFVTSAPPDARGQDLPTTVLREGARLRNGRGEEFLDTGSAPTKDIICRAMVREVLAGRGTPSGSVYYDIRDMDPEIVGRYVQITAALRSRGVDSREAQLEVMPAQHFLMGGVKIDRTAATTVPGLYAVGEVAAGAHGAHRLAAGGGLEVVAGGAIAGESAAAHAASRHRGLALPAATPRPELLGVRLGPEAQGRLDSIRVALSAGCGILRTAEDLAASAAAIQEVLAWSGTAAEPFIRRSALIACAITECALARQESRGDHFRTDYPHRNDLDWLGNHQVTLSEDGELGYAFRAAGQTCAPSTSPSSADAGARPSTMEETS